MRNETTYKAYDQLGNILQMKSVGNWTREYFYNTNDNKLLGHTDGTTEYTYDAHGNILTMPHLTQMNWDYKDQLLGATNGTFESYYVYDASGNRVRKVVEKGNVIEERFYVGDYEVYRKTTSGTLNVERETVHISDDQKRIAMIDNDGTTETIRYQIDNHLGSASLELDQHAATISYEEYHPFGTTSYRSGRSEAEVSLKRYKYVGKERDEETGLYYYGARYYAAWIARFVSVDPLNDDYPELSSYQYASNRPITGIDLDGLEFVSGEEVRNKYDVNRVTKRNVNEFFGNISKPEGNNETEYRASVENYKEKKEAASQNLKNTAETINEVNSVAIDFITLPLDVVGDIAATGYHLAKGEYEDAGFAAAATLIPFVPKSAIKGILKHADELVPLFKLSDDAFTIAKEGGKHSGFYKNALNQTKEQLQKGVNKLQKQINEHKSLIKDPEGTMKSLGKGDWNSLDPRQQKALVEKKWPSDIQRQTEQQTILKGILNSK